MATKWTTYPKLTFGPPAKATTSKAAQAAIDAYAPSLSWMKNQIQTPQQIAALASKSVLATEAATRAAQAAASNKILSQYNNQADRAQGFAQALANIQQGQNDEAMGRYTTAASTLTGLGTGLTGAVSDAYQGQVDKAKEQIARITGGYGQVSAPDAADMRNASQYAGVTAPANTLVADAASAAQLAQNAAAAGQGNIDIIGQNYRAQANQEIGKAAEDARALIAQRPKSIQDLIQQLTTNRSTNITNLVNTLGQRTAYQQAEQKRLDDKAQAAITNRQQWATIDTAKGYLENAAAGITGFTKDGKPTFANVTDKRNFIAQMQTAANTKSSTLGYVVEYDPKSNAFVTKYDKAGHLVPVGGYVLDPSDKTGQNVIPYTAPSKTSSNINTKASSDNGYFIFNDGTVPVGSDGKPIPYTKSTSGQKIDATASKDNGVFVYDDGTHMKGANGKDVPYKTGGGKGSGDGVPGMQNMTPGEVSTLRGNAGTYADEMSKKGEATFQVVEDEDGNNVLKQTNKPHGALTYQDMVGRLYAMGPPTAEWRQRATEIAQSRYPEGTKGRPYEYDSLVDKAQIAYTSGASYAQVLAQGKNNPLVDYAANKKAARFVYYGAGKQGLKYGKAHTNTNASAPTNIYQVPVSTRGAAPKVGAQWNAATDPVDHFLGSMIVTKSGHLVDQGSYIS